MEKKKIVYAVAILVLILIIVLIIFLKPKKAKKEAVKPEPTQEIVTPTVEVKEKIPEKVKTETKKGEVKYEFNVIKKDDKSKVFEIEKQGKKYQLKEAGEKFSFIVNADGRNASLPQIGSDVTGDGKPDMVLQLKSEKDSCSNLFSIFSIEDDFKMVAELKGLAEGIKFKDLDGDGVPEIIGNDCTFLNWWASFGENLAPQVILKNKYGEYHLADSLMRKAPPSESEMGKYIEKNKGGLITYVWKYMLDLIYTGNGNTAWEFYEKVEWDPEWEEQIMQEKEAKNISNKKEFLDAFKEHLTTSPYWDDLKKLNGWEMLEIEM